MTIPDRCNLKGKTNSDFIHTWTATEGEFEDSDFYSEIRTIETNALVATAECSVNNDATILTYVVDRAYVDAAGVGEFAYDVKKVSKTTGLEVFIFEGIIEFELGRTQLP